MPEQGNIVFPRDSGEHWNEAEEWWYLNSHVVTLSGRTLSLFVTFLRDKILLMVNDLAEARTLCRAEIPGRMARTSTSGMNLHFGESWWKDSIDKPSRQELHLDNIGVTIDLVMDSLKPPLLLDNVGRTGFGLLGMSWYYSLPRLDVRGSLKIDGRRETIKGVGWFDRQWGTWEWGGIRGWHWLSLQFEDNIEILFMKTAHPLTGRIMYQTLNIVPPDSKVKVVKCLEVNALGRWTSSRTGITYEVGWILRAPKLTIEVTPCLEDQEIRPGLWEGPCLVRGELDGHSVKGVGFSEQCDSQLNTSGYSRFINLNFALIRHVLRPVFGRQNSSGILPFWAEDIKRRVLLQK